MFVRFVVAAAVMVTAASCSSRSVVPITHPDALQSFCSEHYVPRLGAIENIVTSLKDGDPVPSRLSYQGMLSKAKAQTGIVATWRDLQIIMPEDARRFGEEGEYVHAKRVVIANVPEGAAPPRPVDLEVRDHGAYRWYTFQAYDTQNVCVEGERAF